MLHTFTFIHKKGSFYTKPMCCSLWLWVDWKRWIHCTALILASYFVRNWDSLRNADVVCKHIWYLCCWLKNTMYQELKCRVLQNKTGLSASFLKEEKKRILKCFSVSFYFLRMWLWDEWAVMVTEKYQDTSLLQHPLLYINLEKRKFLYFTFYTVFYICHFELRRPTLYVYSFITTYIRL